MSIHPTAIIDSKAEVDSSAEIGPYVVIEGPVRIGPGVRLAPHVCVMGWTEIAANCVLHAGAAVGGVPQDVAFDGSESYCRIGQDTIIREHATIHRGTKPGTTTTIGRRCMLMAGAHVAHNCCLADEVVLANAALLAGYVEVGSRAFVSGGVVVHQYVRIGDCAMLQGNAQVGRDIPPYMTTDMFGYVAGINIVGLRRAGFSREEREDVKQAYRTLYRKFGIFSEAVSHLADSVQTDAGRRILEFVRGPSRRGMAPRARRVIEKLQTPKED